MSTNVDLKPRKLSILETVANQVRFKLGGGKDPVAEVEVKSDDENKNSKNEDKRFSFTRNLAKLTNKKRGWNAPPDKPFVPLGYFTETHTAIELVKKELPNTRKRLQRSTYRNFLVIQKRERDSEDALKVMNKGKPKEDQIQT